LETKDIRNLGLKLGALAGGLALVYFLILYFSGATLLDPFYKFDFWVTIPFIIVGLIFIRKSEDSLRIWQGLVLGFYITIVCAAIISIFYYIFLMYIDVNFIAEGEQARLDLIQSFIDKYQKINQLDAVKHYQEIYEGNKKLIDQKLNSPLSFAKDKIFWHYLIGGVITFISSILFRK
jgi:hypothetical protein